MPHFPPPLNLPKHQVVVIRMYNPNVTTTSRGRTIEEAIDRMKVAARNYGYWDCTSVFAKPTPETAPEPGSDKDSR
ncbi:MAG: hypothetical protein HC786_22035 [Richelia sp. CSU_2_1]|nr:hypothetical protein [Richelia sp. CSU_2_1]